MRRAPIIISLSALLLASGGAAIYLHHRGGGNTLPSQYYANIAQSEAHIPTIDHVVIIVEENKPQTKIVGNDDAPYINSLVRSYATASHYYAVTHPSLPNYIALTSGTTAGITNDCNPPSTSCQAAVPNIADSIERADKTWKAYMENMPQPCVDNNADSYAVKHNPFMYYPDIRDNASRCTAHDVPLSQLTSDLSAAGSLPDYAFISPDLCNDMHDCSIHTGDNWLAKHVPAILSSPAFTKQHSLLAIIWDEGDSDDNNVLAVFAGSAAKHNYTSATYYSHYSLLHTIEQSWGLQPLTANDHTAPLMSDMLQ